jgi:hypothetical protein
LVALAAAAALGQGAGGGSFSSSARSSEERLLLPDLRSATAEVEEDGEEDGKEEREEGPGLDTPRGHRYLYHGLCPSA